MPDIAPSLPLPTLLSQALVAFTIEFDNEAEHQLRHGSHDAPWLTSMVMWSNCMRFVGEEPVTVGQIEDSARTITNWNGMQRWGYVVVAPDPSQSRPKPPRRDWLVRATPKGRAVRAIWKPLFEVIEKRWQKRFGKEEAGRLRESLAALAGQLDGGLPGCLPILGYGLFSKAQSGRAPEIASDLPLAALLSKVLLAFALEFERESEVSLAICANVLRLLGEEGVRVRDLPRLSGVSKEAIAMSFTFLKARRHIVIERAPAALRTKLARLTESGLKARAAYRRLLGAIETRWRERFGDAAIRHLRETLEALAPNLFLGLEPYPDNWRAAVPQPGTLPHYPMVLHRGGYPDGS